jgi:hypothetical protein
MAISNNNTGIRTGVCTSTTRPTAPYEGQHIYETDTDIEYVWNGSAWVVNYVSAASPAFTGTPTAPTASAGTNTTQLATTAFANQAGGLVWLNTTSFSAATQVDFLSVFSSTMNNYQVVFHELGTTAPGEMIFRLRDSGGLISTSNYDSTRIEQSVGAVNNFSNTAQGQWTASYVPGASPASVSGSMDIYTPNVATQTRFAARIFRNDNATGTIYNIVSGGMFRLTTQMTGFSLIAVGAGTLTGKVSVYGYRI